LGKHWEEFHSQDNLALKIFIALTRHGVLTPADPNVMTQQVQGAARKAISTIVAAIGQRIKKPDPRATHAFAFSNVDVLSHAYDTVAQEHGLTPQALVQLLDEHHATTRAVAEEERTLEAFYDLALTQIALGNYEEAILTATEAAQLAGQELQSVMPDAQQQREAALNATRETVALRRVLAAKHPNAFLPDLATSLNNLGAHLREVGQREAALDATREAVELGRALAIKLPNAFLPDLATSLNNLGAMLSAVGQREAALDATRQAVELYRALAAKHPDAFLPDIAGSVYNLGLCLSAVGQREAALNATREAVDLRRALAATHPDAFLPDLATSLDSLALRLTETGDHDAANAAYHEVAEIRRRLQLKNPRLDDDGGSE
jgi:tetratricopeptide (TPR) repeat protein